MNPDSLNKMYMECLQKSKNIGDRNMDLLRKN